MAEQIKIGFVDYYMSEWHANNYPAWIYEADKDFRIAYAWAEQDVSPRDGVTTAQWCEKFGVEQCASIEELCERSDVILVLAPSNPEKHLPYAKAVLPYGKPTYIDKTFAPNAREAEEIFAIAKKHQTPLFSTSALRFAEELDAWEECNAMITTGSGSSLEEYIIHQIEMVVKKMGVGARAVRAIPFGGSYSFIVRFEGEREAMMSFLPGASFTVCMTNGKKSHCAKVTSPFFVRLIADILRFYKEGKTSFDAAETIAAIKLRDGVLRAVETPDTWVELT